MKSTSSENVDAETGVSQGTPTSGESPSRFLADKPLVTIEPNKSRMPLDLGSLWDYRELLYFMTWRDLKVRYKQTILGIVWVVVQPVSLALVFTLFFGLLVRVPSDGIPYSLFAYSGLLFWTFFASAVTGCNSSLLGSANLITKVYFPRLIIPLAAVGGRLLDFAVGSIVLVGLLIYYDVTLGWGLLMVPVFVVLLVVLSLGVGMWTSAVNVRYRDVGVALPVIVQLWMFASPVIYPSSLIPEGARWLFALNPMTGIIEGFRASLFGIAFDWKAIGLSLAITLIVCAYSTYVFKRTESGFADVI